MLPTPVPCPPSWGRCPCSCVAYQHSSFSQSLMNCARLAHELRWDCPVHEQAQHSSRMTMGNSSGGYALQLRGHLPQEGGHDTGIGGMAPPSPTVASIDCSPQSGGWDTGVARQMSRSAKLIAKYNLSSNFSRVVGYSLQHPRVEGLSPATRAGRGGEKNENKKKHSSKVRWCQGFSHQKIFLKALSKDLYH